MLTGQPPCSRAGGGATGATAVHVADDPGTTGAETTTAAPAPPPTPHHTHPDAPRITFRERNAIVTMRLPLLAHLWWDTDKAVALMLWLHTVVPVISVKALGSVA
mgnify:FL=1